MTFLAKTILVMAALMQFCCGSHCVIADEPPGPSNVTLNRDGNHWQLLRNGQPYYIKGAAGMGSLKLLAESGGNSNRLWGVDESTRQRLDEAHENGISVAVGIWLEHESKGYDYQDFAHVDEQIERVIAAVRELKDHPAVLLWGVGNEMEGYQSGDNPAIWSHVEHLCRLIKHEDPNHPTMSVIAEIGGNRIPAIHKFCPSLDIIGINAYGGAATLPQRYRDAGGTKPYIVSEFGPAGPWEVERNEIGAVVELTSNEKALQYRNSYKNFTSDREYCLGSYSFMWGQKMEATATWFGMFTGDGRKTNLVDTMSELWTSNLPTKHCPEIESLSISSNEVDANETIEVKLVTKKSKEKLNVLWKLLPEADSYITAGDFQQTPDEIENAFIKKTESFARINAPKKGGIYRVYVFVDNGNDTVVTANVPFKVKYQTLVEQGAKVKLPFVIYDESEKTDHIQSPELIGHPDSITCRADYKSNPKFGDQCLYCRNSINSNDCFAVWKFPGGADLYGATNLNVWAKGTAGDERVSIGIGRCEPNSKISDTVEKQKEIRLTKHWKKFELFFENSDLRRVETVFYWAVQSSKDPVEFYLDRIEIE